MGFSPEILEATERALDDQPRGHREIWRRIGCWAPGTIRSTCDELVRQGRAARGSKCISNGGSMWLYTRKTAERA